MKTGLGLLIIDIQNDYFPGGQNELEGSPEASLKAKKVLELFRQNKLPVFHIQHISVRKGSTFFLPNTPGVKIHENVKPIPDEPVIQKHYPNSFRETPLLSILNQSGIKRPIICGMMTNMCVDASVRAASDFGFQCTVLHDACAAKKLEFNGEIVSVKQVHTAFIAALNIVYARIKSTEEFIASFEKE